MAHRDHAGHPARQQPPGHGRRRIVFRLSRLAGFQHKQRQVRVTQHGRQVVRRNNRGAPTTHLAGLVVFYGTRLTSVARVFETQRTPAVTSVVNSVPVEMHHVIRLTVLVSPQQLGFQSRQSGRIEQRQPGQIAQLSQRVHNGPGRDAMIKIRRPLVIRAGTDQQHADRRLARLRLGHVGVRQPAPHAHALDSLEQIPRPVVNQLPRQRQQQRRRLLSLGHGLFGVVTVVVCFAGRERGRIDEHGEAAE